MRFIFADAENIGLKEVESINSTISDKVLVFSKVDSFKDVCERKLFLFMSSYPDGPNQADFYIIGSLVGIIVSLTDEQKRICQFLLYSQDNSLVKAFIFQCQLHKVKYKIVLKPKSQPVIESPQPKISKSLEQKILEQLKKEQTSETVRNNLKLSKSDFTRAFNALIRENKIQRVSKSKKTWTLATRT